MEFVLRRWKEEDAASIQSYANHEKIAANLRNAFPYPYPLDAAVQYIRSCIEQEGDGQVARHCSRWNGRGKYRRFFRKRCV